MDAGADPAFRFDADADPVPTCHSDADQSGYYLSIAADPDMDPFFLIIY